MSFFMRSLSEVSFLVVQARQAARDFSDRFVEQSIAPRVTQIGHGERELACARRLPDYIEPSRMRFGICRKEFAPAGGREGADLGDRFKALYRGGPHLHRNGATGWGLAVHSQSSCHA